MTGGRTRWKRAAATAAVLIPIPALANAQPPVGAGAKGGPNLTRQTQNEIDIALPSLALFIERVTPAVVAISVELKQPNGANRRKHPEAEPFAIRPRRHALQSFLNRFFYQPF